MFLKGSDWFTDWFEGVNAVLLAAAFPHSQSAELAAHYKRQKFTVEKDIEANIIGRHEVFVVEPYIE